MNIGKHYKGGLWNILDPLGFFDFKNFGKGPLSFIQNVSGKYLGTGLTDSDIEANEFSAQEAQKQRDFDAEQAELAYGRQREFYLDFQSPEAQVQQYQEAGLNPALMYGRGATPASAISAPQASGSGAPSSVKPTAGDIGQLASLLSGIAFKAKEVNAEVKLKNAQTNEANARAENFRKENEVFGERFQIWKEVQNSTISNLAANTAYQLAQVDLTRANISKVVAETAWTEAQTILTRIDANNRQAVIDSALAVNQAHIALMTEETAKAGAERRLVEQAYTQRMQKFEYELRQAAAEAGISENEFNAFWTRERLNAVAIQAQAFSAAKSQTSVLFGLINHSGTNLFDFVGLNLAGALTAPSAPAQ